MNKICVKKSKFGRGIFASKKIKANETFHIAHLLILNEKDSTLLKKTNLNNYVYLYNNTKLAIALGYGSLFNHNFSPSAAFEINKKNKTIKFISLQTINKNSEIFINYEYSPKKN